MQHRRPSSGDTHPLATNYISFSLPHKLNGGETVTYLRQGQTAVGGLVDLRKYGTIVRDDFSLYLGATFEGVSVNELTDTIEFGSLVPDLATSDPTDVKFLPGAHRLETGNFVYYFSNGATAVDGLISGKRYRVFKVDESRLKLQDPLLGTPSITFGVFGSTASGDTISVSHSFNENDPVTYHAQAPKVFISTLVDATVSDDEITPSDNEEIYIESHGFPVNGTPVVYRVSGGPAIALETGGSLVHLGTYYVIRLDANRIQLADSPCHATGCFFENDPDTDDDDVTIPQTALRLLPDKTSPADRAQHSLRRSSFEPIGGLVENRVYFVTDADQTAGTFRLRRFEDDATSIVTFDTTGLSGGSHRLAIEGVDLTSLGGRGANHLLVVDLTSTSSGTHKLAGIGGAAAVSGAPSGDRITTASSSGSGGGFIDVGSTSATANATVNTNITVNAGAQITGNDVNITTASRVDVVGTSNGGGGGFVSIGDANATANATNNSKIEISSTAVVTAIDDLLISSGTNTLADALAVTGNGGFIARRR